ncbi:MAG TPA: MATE family efflux transporter [Bacillota bacterium]|nr:MATE family efflux transporter [Bacillota bacterium]
MKRFFEREKAFLAPIFSIALPLALQNLIASSLNMIDTVLIGGLGQSSIAAVGLANQLFFLLNLFTFGINSGTAIFTAQFWGQKDIKNIRRVMGIGLFTGITAGLVFSLVAWLLPKQVLSIFSNDPYVVRLGAGYLRIIATSYVITTVSFCLAFVLRSTGEVMLPVKVSGMALVLNTFLNYAMIYGKFGFPRMEMAGSAWATVIARTVELATLLYVIYRWALVPAARLREIVDFSREFVKRFFKTTIPVILNESLWALGVMMFTVVYARMGTAIVAGVNIFSTIERISMVIFFGLAQACAVSVGNRIGAGDEETALGFAKRYSLIGPVLGLMIGGLLTLGAGALLSIFHVPAATLAISRQILYIFVLVLPFKVFNLINIVGILRSGGDTKFSLFLDTAGLWIFAVPLAFLAGLVWRLPPPMVYLLACSEEVFKFFFGVWRLRSGKWVNNLTHTMRAAVRESES